MKSKLIYFILPLTAIVATSCYKQERNCKDFKTGKFEFTAEVDGEKKTSTFIRTQEYEIETFEGKTDTSSIRWVNDCEYILQKLHPKNMAEKKAVTMKIITTDGNSCVFEYGIVGDARKERGTLVKVGEL
ncbi:MULTISPECIES: DNA topoisomerase IV [Myroides]|uniref:DNA topoisomerase IV n=1 Tax=Myroides albus TaxID=2562892 RepID=A0A6I3LLP5_9FLAO|nr:MULTISPECIES: DNA topoisomerase IV [Myroides]MTG98607.1 DNA topoisomerase IV [Myroides albus]MVX35877.1 DNA topoisomerase IV [Myroides sp. LoEW2-1]UVD79977.1 DNA topoisomerase IV [Myroides albus]